jgi:predicted dehydrogenase
MDMRAFVASDGPAFEAPRTVGTEIIEGAELNHIEIYRNFLAAVETGAPLVAPAEDAIRTLELANAILYSSATAQPVEFPLERQAYAQFLAARRGA